MLVSTRLRAAVLGAAAALTVVACGDERVGEAPPASDYVECAYDAVTGAGEPSNDASCETAIPPDPSAGIPGPGNSD